MKKKIERLIIAHYERLMLKKKLGKQGYARYRRAHNGDEVDVSIKGTEIVVRKGTPDVAVALSCLTGEFESLRYLLPQDYSGIIVDAGGYIGVSALAMRKIFPRAKLIVVEPSDENIKLLRKNLASVGNVEIVHGALVGRETGPVQLRNRGSGEWGFTVVDRPKDKVDAEIIQSVPAFTLSQLVGNVADIGVLKLDIEGGEVDLLTHDLATLRQIPVVFAELHDKIMDGCTDLFLQYSADRIVVKDNVEKFLSIKR